MQTFFVTLLLITIAHCLFPSANCPLAIVHCSLLFNIAITHCLFHIVYRPVPIAVLRVTDLFSRSLLGALLADGCFRFSSLQDIRKNRF